MTSRSEAIGKMLGHFGLRVKRKKFMRKIPGVTRRENDYVRSFVSNDGKVLEWFNDNPAQFSINPRMGNGIPCGSWTVFEDSDDATFSLFTEKMKRFTFERSSAARWPEFFQNPFYGCKSSEEVLVKCDLIGCREEDRYARQ